VFLSKSDDFLANRTFFGVIGAIACGFALFFDLRVEGRLKRDSFQQFKLFRTANVKETGIYKNLEVTK
jgi:hypothetical protein